MPQIKILTIGKIKENYIQEGIGEYLKRMKKRRIEIIELKDSSKQEEGEEILNKIKKLEGYLLIALDEHGVELTSVEFSEFIGKNITCDLCFVIGGPDGLDKKVPDSVDHTVALSRMTFTHEMVRLFLIEQLYRAFAIIEGKKYHRD